ncbi:MAG: very short patch repair endonuclease [Coriobacteriia bacterium]|nr:very short patch repair endonuclease [Coriobacteriia bacterium]
MQGNKGKDTKPELKVRRLLREAGFPGYRLQWKKVPGRPDIAYPGRRVAIFVNGCFWHRCPKCNLPVPKTNADYWEEKFRRNCERDQRKIKELEESGWTVFVIWECDLEGSEKKDFGHIITRLHGKSPSSSHSSHSAKDPQ